MPKTYWVLHDYGSEGWSIVAKCDGIYDAVQAREKDIASGCGTSVIVEHIETLEAYRRADYDRPKDQPNG